eukprot:TRINITY_DN20999_c0_g1_i3.p3 TRINITY_DN20999_c0_g1~~TRINITY_DN20999_c0_g1_i3.p3  ORF type:complete len:103 (-),score=45.17 TRINITY_DN20999_c0_g1_i3:76-384(-)
MCAGLYVQFFCFFFFFQAEDGIRDVERSRGLRRCVQETGVHGTNDKGRLSKEEIDKMIKDAEKFAEQDKEAKEKIDAYNNLDNYLHTMRNTVNDKELSLIHI